MSNDNTAWSRFLFDADGTTTTTTSAANTSTIIASKYVPRVLVTEICSYLRVMELASQLALTSRRGYSTVREYSDHVEAQWKRKVKADPLDESTIEDPPLIMVRDVEFGISVETCIPSSFYEMVELNRDGGYSDCADEEKLRLLTRSRLRSLVVGLNLRETSLLVVNLIASEMPHLRALCVVLREIDFEYLEFPVGLRYLDLYLNGAPCKAGFSAVVESALAALVRCCSKTLVRLALGSGWSFDDWISGPSTLTESEGVVTNLAKLTKLRYLDSGFHDLFLASPKQLRKLTNLTYLQCASESQDRDAFALFYPQLLPASLPFAQLRRCHYFVQDELCTHSVAALSTLHSSLTSLTPEYWCTSEINWLIPFTHLKYLFINYWESEEADPQSQLNVGQLTSILITMTQLEQLSLDLNALKESQLHQIMSALTSLRRLKLGCREIKSIACFTDLPHVRTTLQSLHLPLSDQFEMQHLLCHLPQLSGLNRFILNQEYPRNRALSFLIETINCSGNNFRRSSIQKYLQQPASSTQTQSD